MLNETKIFFDKIKRLRHLITEAVSDNDVVKYIQNHEYVYIYYAGDEKNKRGYRTIRPYVLGVSKAGNKVIRAWQDRGKSVSYSTGKRGSEHDYWRDEDGKTKPGWRMFRLDKIEQIYPIGKKFRNPDGTVIIPPKYNEGSDADMTSIIAYVSTKTQPDAVPTEKTKPTTGEKRTKWDNFSRGNKNNRQIDGDDVQKLRNIASRVYKKALGNFLVVIDNNNEFDIIEVRDKNKVPDTAVVGNLPNLVDTLVKKQEPADNRFFNDVRKTVVNEEDKEKNPTIPYKFKTFFKF